MAKAKLEKLDYSVYLDLSKPFVRPKVSLDQLYRELEKENPLAFRLRLGTLAEWLEIEEERRRRWRSPWVETGWRWGNDIY